MCTPGTYDFVEGLHLDDRPFGVTQYVDVRGMIAYEIDGKRARVARPFRSVLTQGYNPTAGYQSNSYWPGNFSIGMRFRLWEKRADILNIYNSSLHHLLGIIASSRRVILRLNGGKAVKIANWNMSDFQFHRIFLSFRGSQVTARASGPDFHDCGLPVTTELKYGEEDREIPLDYSLVVLGRITRKKISKTQ